MRSPASLRTGAEFQHVLAGAKARSDGLTVYVAGRGDEGPPRLGLAVGRRVGGAVQRNRIKRRVRAAFRAWSGRGVDVLVKAGPSAAGLSYQDLENHLIRALTRASRST